MSYVNFRRAKENENAIHRVRRAGPSNKLTLFSDHMQVLARVANAVALQIKMAESTEPSDDAIGELLKMGLMTPEQLVTADWQPTKTAIGDLKKLPTQLKTSTDITKTEDRLEVLEKMRSSQVDVTKIKDLPGKKEFEDTANGVKGSIDKNKITEVFKAVGNLKGELTTIAETGDEDAAKQDDVVNILFVTKWEKVEKTCKDAVSVLDNIKKIASLGDKSAFFQLLVEERKVGEQYVLFQFDNDFLNDIIANSDLLQNTGTTFASNADSLKLLRSFIEARQSKRNSAVATNGFVNGLDDFDRLDGDTVNDWLSNAGKLDADTRRGILKALESLKEFKTRTNTVETDWAPLNGLTTSTKTVVDEQLLIVDHTTSVKTTVQEFQSCDHTKSPVKDIAITAAFRATVNKLKAAAPTLALFEEMSKLKDLSAFKNVIAPIDGLAKDEKKKKAWQVVQDLKAIPAFNQTYELVQKLASKTTEMETTLTEAQKDVDAIDIGPVNTYHKSVVDSEILEVYSCLRTKTGGEALFKSIELVRSIRGSPLDTQTDEAGQFVDTLDGSKQTLENLRQWTQNVTATSDEEKALKVLADAQTVSAQLGTAVRGLVAIGEVLGKKPQLDPLLGDLAFVSAAVNVHMSQLSAEELAELQKLDALKTSLTDMFQKIDAYEAVVNGLADSDFKAGAPAFAAANEIPDVVVDIGKMRAALQALKQLSANDQSPPDLDPLIGAIDSLDGLSLDFSSFSFASAPGSLSALDQFFGQFRTSLQSAPAVNGNIAGSAPGGNNANNAGLLNGESTVDSTETVLLVIVLIMAAVAVICSVLSSLYAIHRRKKNKEEAKKAEEEAKKTEEEARKIATREKQNEKELTKLRAEVAAKNPPPEEIDPRLLDLVFGDTRDDPQIRQIVESMGEAVTKQFCKTGPRPGKRQVFSPIGWFQNQITIVEAAGDMDDGESIRFRRECRDPDLRCRMNTACRVEGFDNTFIHANVITIGEFRWIMAQGPLGPKDLSGDRMDTCEKHWALVEQYRVKCSLQLSRFEEMGKRQQLVSRCAEYYATTPGQSKQFGRYTVKTMRMLPLAEITVDRQAYKGYEIELTNSNTKKTWRTDIVHYDGWLANGVLQNPAVVLEMIHCVQSRLEIGQPDSVLVHCSTGVGRTGTIVAIRLALYQLLKHKPITLFSVLCDIHNCRLGAIKYADELWLVLFTLLHTMMKRSKITFNTSYAIMEHSMDMFAEQPQTTPLVYDRGSAQEYFRESGAFVARRKEGKPGKMDPKEETKEEEKQTGNTTTEEAPATNQ